MVILLFMSGESFSFDDVLPTWVDSVDGVDVIVHRALDFSKLTFPDGTVSFHYDDGRVTTFCADGSMDVINPEDDHYAHHSPEELAIDAIGLEVILRAKMPFPDNDELSQ